MRVTTVFRKLLGVTQTIVEDVAFLEKDVMVHVRPTWKKPRCGGCQGVAPGYDQRPTRSWRHLSLGGWVLRLVYAPCRVDCPSCGVRVEHVPWAETGSRFSAMLEELVAYLTQITDKTKVTEIAGVSWEAVGSIVERVVNRRLDSCRFDELRSIGVDEFSYRKRHRYLTVVVDHDRNRVIWAAEGRTTETLRSFFSLLGPERCAAIENVTIDMSEAYLSAVKESLPNAQVVFDRFHVQRLASDAVDEVRRSIVRELHGQPEAKSVKKTRFVLLKHPADLTPEEKTRLAELQRKNRSLYRAYLLKETLAQALDYVQPGRASNALRDWLAWASRSRLEPFKKVARTIRRHFAGVIGYVATRLTNGLVEGINNKIRMIARRAFGFHSADALKGMIFLCCGGIHLDPPLPRPTQT